MKTVWPSPAFSSNMPKCGGCGIPACPLTPTTPSPGGRCRALAAWSVLRSTATARPRPALSTRLRLPHIAASLGGVDSLIEQPAIMSYYDADPEARQALGIRDALVRFAIGIEEAADLIADLAQALAAV